MKASHCPVLPDCSHRQQRELCSNGSTGAVKLVVGVWFGWHWWMPDPSSSFSGNLALFSLTYTGKITGIGLSRSIGNQAAYQRVSKIILITFSWLSDSPIHWMQCALHHCGTPSMGGTALSALSGLQATINLQNLLPGNVTLATNRWLLKMSVSVEPPCSETVYHCSAEWGEQNKEELFLSCCACEFLGCWFSGTCGGWSRVLCFNEIQHSSQDWIDTRRIMASNQGSLDYWFCLRASGLYHGSL